MHPANPRYRERLSLWGAVAHGGGGGEQESEVTSEPWEGVQPYLRQAYSKAGELFGQPQQFFSDPTYVGFAPETEQALGLTAERARTGSGLNMAAQGALGNLIGQPTQQNPYFQQVGQDVAASVLPQVAAQFGGAGRSADSPLAQQAATTAMTRALAPYAYGGYESGEQRRLQGMGMAPGMAATDYDDFARLAEVGRTREQQVGQELADRMARWEFQQEEPWQRTSRFMSLLGGGGPWGTTTTTGGGGGGSPLMGALGLGLTAAGTAGGLGWSPFQ